MEKAIERLEKLEAATGGRAIRPDLLNTNERKIVTFICLEIDAINARLDALKKELRCQKS